MARTTTPVSLTLEARDELRDLGMEITVAARARVTHSAALRVAVAVARKHPDELASALADLKSQEDDTE
jgi:hypothetical protein